MRGDWRRAIRRLPERSPLLIHEIEEEATPPWWRLKVLREGRRDLDDEQILAVRSPLGPGKRRSSETDQQKMASIEKAHFRDNVAEKRLLP